MGPEGYGLFAGFAGLATTLGALTGLGFGLLMLQAASREAASFSANWSRTLLATGISAVMLLGVYVVIAKFTTGYEIEPTMLVAIALPELLCLPMTIVSSYAFQAHERMGWAGAMYALGPVGNLSALAAFLYSGIDRTLENYLSWHLWVSLAIAGLSLTAVGLVLRPGLSRPRLSRVDRAEAIGYTGMRVVDSGLGSIDKTLVLRLAGSEVAGQYTAAYRLAALIALPAISLAIAATPRLFRSSSQSSIETGKLVAKVFRWGLIFGVASLPLAWAVAHALPLLFGAEFEPAGTLARMLAPFPALLGFSAIGCAVLMALGRRRSRIIIQLGAILALVGLMLWLAPAGGGRGATQALLLTYAAMAFALWSTILRPARTIGR